VPAKWRAPETLADLAGGTVKSLLHLFSQTMIVLLTLVFILFEAQVADNISIRGRLHGSALGESRTGF